MDNTPQRPSPKLSPLQPSAVAVSRNTVILANETTKDYTLETKPDCSMPAVVTCKVPAGSQVVINFPIGWSGTVILSRKIRDAGPQNPRWGAPPWWTPEPAQFQTLSFCLVFQCAAAERKTTFYVKDSNKHDKDDVRENLSLLVKEHGVDVAPVTIATPITDMRFTDCTKIFCFIRPDVSDCSDCVRVENCD